MSNVNLRLEALEYSNRVLGVIKEKFGLKDKSEALNKLCDLYGEEFVEKEVDEDLISEMIDNCAEWEKKHKFKRKMSIKELDKLCEVSN